MGAGVGCSSGGWMVAKVVGFIIGSLVFSAIFWWTHNKMVNCCNTKKKKK